jgi:hypothetical protein
MRGRIATSACFVVLTGCAIVPDIPSDFGLPVAEILAQTSCELQDAFISINAIPEFRRFNAPQWLITISLAPKTDTDITIGAGVTRRGLGNPLRFSTWAISTPGVQYDAKGERSSGVNFTFKSAELMADRTLQCPPESPSIHVLAKYLGVGEWLRRTAAAMAVASSVNIDKPVYNTDITIKFAGNGSYTFTIPRGTDLGSLAGSYVVDEQLNISMTPIAPKTTLHVTTLPQGGLYKGAVTTTAAVQAAQTRLDFLSLEQAIKSIQARP